MYDSLRDLTGVEFPLFAFSHCRDVVAAVSRAGGFGVLGGTTFTPESLEIELKWIDEHVNGKPYGVVLMKKYKDWHEADRKAKNKPLEEMDKAIKRGTAHEQAGERGPHHHLEHTGRAASYRLDLTDADACAQLGVPYCWSSVSFDAGP